MRELVRTHDAVLISALDALLDGADIPHLVFDDHVAQIGVGFLPQVRILVEDQHLADARRLLTDAGLGHELVK